MAERGLKFRLALNRFCARSARIAGSDSPLTIALYRQCGRLRLTNTFRKTFLNSTHRQVRGLRLNQSSGSRLRLIGWIDRYFLSCNVGVNANMSEKPSKTFPCPQWRQVAVRTARLTIGQE